jgi:hypothetical protein
MLLLIWDVQILEELYPATKFIGKFLKTWSVGESTRSQNHCIQPTSTFLDGQDSASIALTMFKCLIATSKNKRVLSIEAGPEMVALGLIICSMVCQISGYVPQSFRLIAC